MTILETNIAGSVKSMEYVRNHHYLRLRAHDGTETLLLEHGVIEYLCERCNYRWWSECNRANTCPCCQSDSTKQRWLRPQVALIPEEESGFELVNKPREPKDAG